MWCICIYSLNMSSCKYKCIHMNSYMSSCKYKCIHMNSYWVCDTFVFTTQYEFMWYICIYYSIWVKLIHLYLLLNWVHLIHLYLLLNMSSCDTFVFTTQYEFMWYKCIYMNSIEYVNTNVFTYSIWVHLIHLYLLLNMSSVDTNVSHELNWVFDTFVFTTQYEFMWYICIYYSIWVHVNTNVFTTQYEFMWYICIYYSIE